MNARIPATIFALACVFASACFPARTADLQTGLKVYYKLDELSGTTASDSSGAGHTMTISPNGSWTAIAVNGGADFYGNARLGSCPSFSWDASKPVTVSFWIYKGVFGWENAAASIFGFSPAGNNQFRAQLVRADKRLYWDYGDPAGAGRLSIDFTPFLDTFAHVVLVSAGNGGGFKAIYVNGKLITSSLVSDAPAQALSNLELSHWPADAFNTNMGNLGLDEFRIYDRVLDLTEILNLATPDTIGLEFGPVGVISGMPGAGVIPRGNWAPLQQYNEPDPTQVRGVLYNIVLQTTVTWSSSGFMDTRIANGNSDRLMMRYALYAAGTNSVTVSVNNLPEYYSTYGYNVYVYYDGDNGAEARSADFKIGNTSITALDDANASFNGTYVESVNGSAGNYVVFRGQTANSFTLTGTPLSGPSTPTVAINGVQIVALNAPNLAPPGQVPPNAGTDYYTTAKNQVLNVAGPGLLINDGDVNGDAIISVADSAPSYGTLQLNPDGSFQYTPANGYVGRDTFTYRARDGQGNDSASTPVTIDVLETNTPLKVWYKMNEGAGTVVHDSSSNGNDSVVVNGALWTPGPEGYAFSFDGANDYISDPDFTWPPGPVTVSFWTYVRTADINGSCPFGVGAGGIQRFQAHVPFYDKNIYWDYGTEAQHGRILANYTPYLDKWSHVTLVSNGGPGGAFKAIYLDGQLAASDTRSNAPSGPQIGLQVGHATNDAVGTGHFKGKLDDFRIYDRVLTPAEISQLIQTSPTTTVATSASATFKTTAQNIPLSATVTAADTVTQGSVTFQLKNGNVNVGSAVTANVVNGVANSVYTLPASTPLGTYTILASFSGTAGYAASTDNSKTLTVELATTTLSAHSVAAAVSAADQNFTLTASVASNAGVVNEGTVTFQVKDGQSNLGVAASGPVANGSASASYIIPGGTPLGSYTIEAAYSGTNFTSATDNTHFLNIVVANTTTAENATAEFRSSAQSITLNASVSGDAGIVNEGTVMFQIKDGAANIGAAVLSPVVVNGAASAVYSLPGGTPAKTYSIVASFSGTATLPPSSDTKNLTINKAATTTTAVNAATPYSFANQTVALAIQIASPAGAVNEGTVTVQLKSGAQNVGNPATSNTVSNGSATVNYTLPAGTPQGVYEIQAVYNGGASLTSSSDNSKTLTVQKATPVITWSNPAAISYGTALDGTQLTAEVGGVPGTFQYNPPAGSVLAVGNNQPLSVFFAPNDTANYTNAQKTITLSVLKKALTVTADDKVKLSGAQNPPLTASYSGFANNETAAVLTGSPAISTTVNTTTPPGSYPITISQGTLSASNYSFTCVNGTLTVSNQPVFLNLSAPTVSYGAATTRLSGTISFGASGSVNITLNGTTQNATIDANGAFFSDFTTSSLDVGAHPIQYDFPGGGGYQPVSDSRTLTVAPSAPAITWTAPANIAYGTALSATQLNAGASVPGNFQYTPAAGTVLSAGTHQLSVQFLPSDTAHYSAATATVNLVVSRVHPEVVWEAPADIVYGTALSETQLNASSNAAGQFIYTPNAGTILNAGAARQLTATFLPDDQANYMVATAQVAINVSKANQSITFAQISDQEIGSPPLNLTASASSNLSVTITLVSGNATLQGNTLTLTGLGPVTLRAEQSGNTNYNTAAPQERTFNVFVILPQFTNALSMSGTQGQAFTFALTASGTQPITFASGTLPPGLSLDADTGAISGASTGSGAFQVTVTAQNAGGTDNELLTLTFLNSSGGDNHAPTFTSSGAVATPNPTALNQQTTFTASANDEDGDAVAFVWDFGDGAQAFGSTATHRYTTIGVFNARVTITDGVASEYLEIPVVVNHSLIAAEQYRLYAVSKLALKLNFTKALADSLSISGTVPLPPAFAPTGKAVSFESAGVERTGTLDKKATSADKAFKLTGKFAKDGTLTGSPAKFALALKNQDLFTGLSPLGFVNDNTPKGKIVPMPVILVIEGSGYLATVNVKYAAKKDKSGSGKK